MWSAIVLRMTTGELPRDGAEMQPCVGPKALVKQLFTPRLIYSRSEQRADAAIHMVGLFAALVAVPFLLGAAMVRSFDSGNGLFIASALIYGLCFLAMIGASALYNMTPSATLNWLYRRLDHSAIYLKIAGTYTPFTLVTGQGIWLMLGLWGAAGLGVVMKCVALERSQIFALCLYLGMGWIGLMILPDLATALPMAVLVLMVAGGVTYTLGVGFYLCTGLRYHYAIWHVFVLVASFLLYGAIMTMLLIA